MSTSQRTFDQVKSILGKLDQRIDALRERRTHDGQPIAASIQHQTIPAMPLPAVPVAPTTPPASRSAYGRATPLRG